MGTVNFFTRYSLECPSVQKEDWVYLFFHFYFRPFFHGFFLKQSLMSTQFLLRNTFVWPCSIFTRFPFTRNISIAQIGRWIYTFHILNYYKLLWYKSIFGSSVVHVSVRFLVGTVRLSVPLTASTMEATTTTIFAEISFGRKFVKIHFARLCVSSANNEQNPHEIGSS